MSSENYCLSQEIKLLSHELYCWYTKDEYLLQEEEQSLLQEIHIDSQEKILTVSHKKNITREKFLPKTGKIFL